MQFQRMAALAAAAVFAIATAASSAVVSIDVDTSPDLAMYGLNGSFSDVSVVSGNSPNNYASPFGNGSQSYYTVGSPNLTPSPAILTVAPTNTFGLLWGSIDSYNLIQFFSGIDFIGFVTGADLGLGTAGNVTAGVTITTDDFFDTVKFSSNFGNNGTDIPAFEFATAPAPVPVPAAGLLLLGALGGLAALRRRTAV